MKRIPSSYLAAVRAIGTTASELRSSGELTSSAFRDLQSVVTASVVSLYHTALPRFKVGDHVRYRVLNHVRYATIKHMEGRRISLYDESGFVDVFSLRKDGRYISVGCSLSDANDGGWIL